MASERHSEKKNILIELENPGIPTNSPSQGTDPCGLTHCQQPTSNSLIANAMGSYHLNFCTFLNGILDGNLTRLKIHIFENNLFYIIHIKYILKYQVFFKYTLNEHLIHETYSEE
jgi:hypothetical protein